MDTLDFAFQILAKLFPTGEETVFGITTKGEKGKVTVPVTTSLSAIADMGFNYTFKGSKVSIHYAV
jgi:hypothetical protein